MYYFVSLYNIISLIIYLIFIFKLKNCPCSDNWKKEFILVVSFIFIGVNVIFIILNSIMKLSNKSLLITSNLVIILNIIYTVIMLIYTHHLKKEQCKCSNMWEREYAYITSLISVIFMCINIIAITSVSVLYKIGYNKMNYIKYELNKEIKNKKKKDKSKKVKKGKKK